MPRVALGAWLPMREKISEDCRLSALAQRGTVASAAGRFRLSGFATGSVPLDPCLILVVGSLSVGLLSCRLGTLGAEETS